MNGAVPGLLVAAALLHAGPALTARGAGRRLLPALSGAGRSGGIALTFDDGPDPRGTPVVLDALAQRGWAATFFVLGEQVRRRPDLARRLLEEGHELALHGHVHRAHLARSPRAVVRDLQLAHDVVVGETGATPRWWRPPYGVLSGGGLVAARRLGLSPVLWTAWGQDWRRTDGPAVARTVLHDLADGGCVLLHDSDVTSVPGSWRATADSLPLLAAAVEDAGWEVRRLDAHLPVPPA